MAIERETLQALGFARRIVDDPNSARTELLNLARQFLASVENDPDIAVQQFLADRQKLIDAA